VFPPFFHRGKSTKKFCRPKKLVVESEIELVFSGKFLNSCRVNINKLNKKLGCTHNNPVLAEYDKNFRDI
jgi:hypothetical protein